MSSSLSALQGPRQSLGQRLRVKQSQRLALRQQQSIRLLQLSNAELQAEIQEKLESNIMLEPDGEEREEERLGAVDIPQSPDQAEPPEPSEPPELPSMAGPLPDEWSADVDRGMDMVHEDGAFAPRGAGAARKDDVWEYRDVCAASLYSSLMEQLQHTPLPDGEAEPAAAIIRALDEDGFLRCPLEELGEDVGQLEKALRRVQSMEPAGVAARDVGECLSLQLLDLPEDTPHLEVAQRVVEEHLPLLERREHARLARLLRLSPEQLRQALELLRSLTPRPGNLVGEQGIEYIKPDLFLTEAANGAWQVELNEELYPKLRINSRYRRLLQLRARAESARAAQAAKLGQEETGEELLKAHLEEAKWFKNALKNRGDTLKKVAECIVGRQAGFFRAGVQVIRPMILRQIAEVLKVHESTVSRAVNKKYMQTPRGTFELKYFFSSGIVTAAGGVCSSLAIRSKIQQLVREEDPAHPLSDKKIAELLLEQGISVARRTVAKYRGSICILSASQRRQHHVSHHTSSTPQGGRSPCS